MASYPSSPLAAAVILAAALLGPAVGCYTSIIGFGDSITDTGNYFLSLNGEYSHISHFPYGETFFNGSTGRFSDGRIIIDFMAEAMGLPLVPPYLGGESAGGDDFRRGVNFAVGTATALGNDFFRAMGMRVTWTNYSLGVQIRWFKELLPSLCSSGPECYETLSKSLFLVGEIGGNDYNYQFELARGRTLEEIQATVPKVIKAISSTINDLINLGARTLVVPGNFPIGCVAWYLTTFQSSREEDYDPQTGCIKWLNDFSEYHNSQLQQELDCIRRHHPEATIIYADYYNATLAILRSPNLFGFGDRPLSACCGGGGPYNYNASVTCGNRRAAVCDDPSRYLCWDGMHFTEAAYKIIAKGILDGPFAIPRINYACPQIGAEFI